MPSNTVAFLRGWTRDPMAVGLPFASSYWTARRLAQCALDDAIPGGGPLLELGAGTGAVTEALLDTGCPRDQLIVVERDRELCRSLQARFPGLMVLHGDALDIDRWRGKAGVSSVCGVVSGLPMRVVRPRAAARCYRAAFDLMPRGGAIIQYTYGMRPPVDPQLAGLRLDARFLGREWRNLPPIAIWRYRQPAEATLEAAMQRTPAQSV